MSNIITIMADKIMVTNNTLANYHCSDIIHKTKYDEQSETSCDNLDVMTDGKNKL